MKVSLGTSRFVTQSILISFGSIRLDAHSNRCASLTCFLVNHDGDIVQGSGRLNAAAFASPLTNPQGICHM